MPHLTVIDFLLFLSVHSTYNYLGRHINNLISAFHSGDLVQARSIQVLYASLFSLIAAARLFPDVFLVSPSSWQFKLQELLSHAMQLGEDTLIHVT